MKNLTAYVEHKNRWEIYFNKPAIDLDKPKDIQRIYENLQVDLSPENLTCDGELRGRALQSKTNQLQSALAEIRKLAENRGITLKEFNYEF